MSEVIATTPTAREQIAGLTFAMMLVAPDMTIFEVNPATENLLGVSARRLKGRSLSDVLTFEGERALGMIAGSDSQIVARGLNLLSGGRKLRVNLSLSPLDGGWRVVTLSDEGQGERFGEEDRRPILRGPAVLAHEIKNPLAAIRGAAQLLARKAREADRALTDLIADEVDRIAQLIDRMQRLGRERAEPIVPVNPHAAIRRAVETVQAAATGEFDFLVREEFDPSLPPVLANEGALVQVLINLLANARDASASATKPVVTIRTRFVSGLVLNVIRLGRPVKLPIEIQITDNGSGIDPALQEHIFEPFVSSKPNGQGLGLALVQKLLRDMDARISHEREEAEGLTHFRIHLPMAR